MMNDFAAVNKELCNVVSVPKKGANFSERSVSVCEPCLVKTFTLEWLDKNVFSYMHEITLSRLS